ncbi:MULTISPECIES: hypothetical protein [unclassified Rhodococcus (in: high G+C Gram-positive bacteria)]|uniref:hypothetical protein n=1 Tax=unclassified Rhodococcus (in: high G+C Gram-positive bacteria) TaxID=192944 RepID=UPI00135A4AC3|nr:MULTISPECIES: hypothetical protein [unclassified Rhodococcus (in: high G+C Gram-positive bacteria)]
MTYTGKLEGPADVQEVTKLLGNHTPEPIREHWVDAGGVRYPPKQVYQALSGDPRSTFTSHLALARLRRMGFTTSTYQPRKDGPHRKATLVESQTIDGELSASFATLLSFLTDHKLTNHLASAEEALAGAAITGCNDVVTEFRFSEDLLDAALAIRQHVGRLSDVIHATVIARCLPLILEPGETVTVRPSLGAGNDPSRPFDVETDRRVAEFKVAQWKGADTMRKRGVFADLVHLAFDESDRRAQMFIVGPLPRKFLTSSKATAEWALARSSPHTRRRFEEKFGPGGGFTIAEFTGGPAAHIEIIDLASFIPSLGLPDGLL